MFLTTPVTTVPSFRVSISFWRSSPIDASMTARRDSTTLLRLRSSLMTLNSRVLPSNGVVSLTGRVSTSEPGRNARMPLVRTVRPPLTLPFTRSEEHTSELQSRFDLVCRLLLEKKKKKNICINLKNHKDKLTYK